MSKETQSFELSDFSKYQWTEVIKPVNRQKCKEYSKVFQAKAEEYRLNSDSVAQEVFLFLSRVTASWIEHFGIKNTSTS